MRRLSREQERHGIRSEISRGNYSEGTASRTRPISSDEIVHSRKNKKLSGDYKAVLEGGNKAGKVIVEHVFDRFEPDRGHKDIEDYLPPSVKHREDTFFRASLKKEKHTTALKKESLVNEKDKASHEMKTKFKSKLDKDISSKAKEDMVDRLGHRQRRDDKRPSTDSKNEIERNYSRYSLGTDKYVDINRRKSGPMTDSRNEVEMSRLRNSSDVYGDISRRKYDSEIKRKDRNQVDEKFRDKIANKKHKFGKHPNTDYSDRKDLQSHYQESRENKRQYRIRDPDNKDSRSHSISPKEEKHTSYKGREHGDQALHPLQDRSGRKHSDFDRSIPSNGSSNHYHRNGGSKSGLGGYSPRKRRTEVGVKTPSPTARSPEKKRAGWDLPPVGSDNPFPGSLLSNFQSSDPTISLPVPKLASVLPLNISNVNSFIGMTNTLSLKQNSYSTDSVQLTQATQPLRRLYVENVPDSTSEKEVMECFNNFLLSSRVINIRGTQPCISCNIHREKSQAIVEFLTPEDASTAISFDGSFFSGSILKIRRPKDFFEVPTGVQEKSTPATDAICDIVIDSPHKIFIGGISKVLSSKMIMGIASVFGSLKAFHFQVNEDLDGSCAFLEYVDPLVTPKACAGLNGMKLGGKVLTAVQATPNAQILDNTINLPFDRVPEHVMPLLDKPTVVLKLKNVYDPEGLPLLSEPELEEMLEDVRLECARFGAVKSVNIIKHNFSSIFNTETSAITDQELECDEVNMDRTEEILSSEIEENNKVEVPSNNVVENMVQDKETDNPERMDVGSPKDCVNEELCKADPIDCVDVDDSKSIVIENVDDKKQACNSEEIFEPGCVLVEYGRPEASCSAAHCLHGRLFDDRVISVEYIPLKVYLTRFPK